MSIGQQQRYIRSHKAAAVTITSSQTVRQFSTVRSATSYNSYLPAGQLASHVFKEQMFE